MQPVHVCELCFGPLEIRYDYAAIGKVLTRARIEQSVQARQDVELDSPALIDELVAPKLLAAKRWQRHVDRAIAGPTQ